MDIIGSSYNTIYHNNFVNSTNLAKVSNSTNTWDDGSSGNYWSDYKTRYPDASEIDKSGVGNSQYIIDADNKDSYPLIQPFSIPSVTEPTPTPVSNSTTVPVDFPTDMVVTVLALTITVIIVAIFAVYAKRRHR
ncbi:MAG: NosD domain-containing protein [Candidatus Bathyarchaeia archaeon]